MTLLLAVRNAEERDGGRLYACEALRPILFCGVRVTH
jgi:hypothetical protein